MKTFKLKNGIPVILEQMHGTDVVTALILFKVGSRNETKSINGISHFLEHLFFKGTEHRPTTLDISQELDGLGADYNAFTSKDYTGYYVKVSNKHTKTAVNILEDILFHPIFDPEEIHRERGVILEEINMYEDNPMAISEELSEQLLFGAQHPLGYRIAGPPENIMKISRKAIMNYRDTYYHPDNMVIIIAGNLPKQIREMITQQFASADSSTHRTPTQKKFTFSQNKPRLHIQRKSTAQAHLALSFPAPTYSSKELPAARVLATILGGNMSSRLFINVRERKGLCYYIRAQISPYEDMGAFTIQAGFDKSRIHQAIQAIIDELIDIRKKAPTDEELHKAKEYIRGKMSIRMEDSENVATLWGSQYLFRKKSLQSSNEYIKEIQNVTKLQVHLYAKKIFFSKKANLAVIGPFTAVQQKKFKEHFIF